MDNQGEAITANTETDLETPTPRDFLAEAKRQGWTEKDEFKGDPDKWVDAQTFVERQEDNIGLLRKKTGFLERKLAEQDQLIARSAKHLSDLDQRAYERAMAAIKAQMEQAVEAGDVDEFKKLTAEADKLSADAKSEKSTYTADDAEIAMDEFREANPWYDRAHTARSTDDDIAARAYFDKLVKQNIGMAKPGPDQVAPDEFFGMISAKVAERYPQLSAKPSQQRAKPSPDVAAPTGGRMASSAKTYAALPADAKRACDDLIQMKVYGDIPADKAREKYAADYFGK